MSFTDGFSEFVTRIHVAADLVMEEADRQGLTFIPDPNPGSRTACCDKPVVVGEKIKAVYRSEVGQLYCSVCILDDLKERKQRDERP